MVRTLERRTLLGALAGAGVAGLAGCSVNPPRVDDASYRDWLHEPGIIGDADHYPFAAVDVATFADRESAERWSTDELGRWSSRRGRIEACSRGW